MSTQLNPSFDLLSEEGQQKEAVSSLGLSSDFINQFKKRFPKELPKEQILPYLTNPVPESFNQNLYEQLSKETVPFKESGIPPIVRLRIGHLVGDKFVSLQKWEGIVMEVMKDSFLARLIDLTEKGPEEEAEFPLEEVSEEDRELIKPGAIFYWNIGYHDSYRGQRTRVSLIRFRRLPSWREEEIEAAKREAKRIGESIGWK